MRWRYDQRLIEAVIFQEVEQSRLKDESRLAERYHRMTNPLYERTEMQGREQAFFDVHWRLFVECGLDGLFAQELAKRPRIAAQVPEGLIARAASAREEGTELFAREGVYTMVLLRLRPQQFLDRAALARFSAHELLHVDDMLDPDFAYQREDLAEKKSAMDTQLVRGRYRVLWSISVDGRLAKEGSAPWLDQGLWQSAFDRTFPFVEPQIAKTWFDRLWDGSRPGHSELMTMARDPRAVMALRGAQSRQGLPCPLCEFPSHEWVASKELSEGVQKQIKAEFPSWDLAEGVCGRCAEVYAVQQAAALSSGKGAS